MEYHVQYINWRKLAGFLVITAQGWDGHLSVGDEQLNCATLGFLRVYSSIFIILHFIYYY